MDFNSWRSDLYVKTDGSIPYFEVTLRNLFKRKFFKLKHRDGSIEYDASNVKVTDSMVVGWHCIVGSYPDLKICTSVSQGFDNEIVGYYGHAKETK